MYVAKDGMQKITEPSMYARAARARAKRSASSDKDAAKDPLVLRSSPACSVDVRLTSQAFIEDEKKIEDRFHTYMYRPRCTS